ncbi:MAG: tetratricopeptide repeat protein [Chloroflexi bacterium]|nr:tetratricopeptide repeat protein [Chloroflexota bacterium]
MGVRLDQALPSDGAPGPRRLQPRRGRPGRDRPHLHAGRRAAARHRTGRRLGALAGPVGNPRAVGERAGHPREPHPQHPPRLRSLLVPAGRIRAGGLCPPVDLPRRLYARGDPVGHRRQPAHDRLAGRQIAALASARRPLRDARTAAPVRDRAARSPVGRGSGAVAALRLLRRPGRPLGARRAGPPAARRVGDPGTGIPEHPRRLAVCRAAWARKRSRNCWRCGTSSTFARAGARARSCSAPRRPAWRADARPSDGAAVGLHVSARAGRTDPPARRAQHGRFPLRRHRGRAGDAAADSWPPHLFQGDLSGAPAYYEQAIALATRYNDPLVVVTALIRLGASAINAGDYAEGRSSLQRALELSRRIGDIMSTSLALINLGELEMLVGDVEAAAIYYRGALGTAQRIRQHYVIAGALAELGRVAFLHGRYEEAERLVEQSLSLHLEHGNLRFAVRCHAYLASIACAQDDYARANAHFLRAFEYTFAVHAFGPGVRPLLFLADCFARQGDFARAVEIWTLVARYDGSSREQQEEAARRCEETASLIPAERFDAAARRGSGIDVETMLTSLMTELAGQAGALAAPRTDPTPPLARR